MNIKNTLFNLTLLGIGGVAGYFIAQKKLQGKYQEDLADVQDFYYKKLQELGVMEPDFEFEEEMTDEELLEEFKRVTGDGIDTGIIDEVDKYLNNNVVKLDKKKNETSKNTSFDRGKGRPIINYNKPPLEKILSEKEDEEETDGEVENDQDYEAEIEARAEEFIKRRYENQLSGEPYCINHAEAEDAPEEYDKQVLYYYIKDRILCEDDDSIVDDESIVGLDYEDALNIQTIAWVRNDQLCIIYEIHRIDDSYTNVVTNAFETPREREFRLVSRRKQALDD